MKLTFLQLLNFAVYMLYQILIMERPLKNSSFQFKFHFIKPWGLFQCGFSSDKRKVADCLLEIRFISAGLIFTKKHDFVLLYCKIEKI